MRYSIYFGRKCRYNNRRAIIVDFCGEGMPYVTPQYKIAIQDEVVQPWVTLDKLEFLESSAVIQKNGEQWTAYPEYRW